MKNYAGRKDLFNLHLQHYCITVSVPGVVTQTLTLYIFSLGAMSDPGWVIWGKCPPPCGVAIASYFF